MDRPDFSSSNMMPMGGVIPVRQTREQRRLKKELEEARKAGKAPAEKDEEGNAINPHIPQFISRAPWYVDETGGASLKHQRVQHEHEQDDKDKWYQRGVRAGPAATKYRKGACENCGAKTHKAKDCMERPRKLGAKWTGKDIQPDEVIQNVELGWNAKRDRWNGYDPSDHRVIVEEYERLEELWEHEEKKKEGEQTVEEKFAEVAEAVGQAYDPSSRIMTRNLRMREDTATYLLASDNSSYDPKTRTMHPETKTITQESTENEFVRASTGEAADFEKLQKFAWQAEERGATFNIQANPTEGAILHRKYLEEKDRQKSKIKDSILEKYGGEQFLVAPPKELTQSEAYVEYSTSGKIIKGADPSTKSRWKEDVYPNNHTSVFGSWWKEGKWGYACCHSLIKNSWCAGKDGLEALEIAEKLAHDEVQPIKSEKPAISSLIDTNKRGYGEVSEEEMEEWRRKKQAFDDPMRNYVDHSTSYIL